jgi:hypothetical protein
VDVKDGRRLREFQLCGEGGTGGNEMNIFYSERGYCNRWGSQQGARRVAGLSKTEKEGIRNGVEWRITGCPLDRKGRTERRVIYSNGRYYTRMIDYGIESKGVV